MNLRSIVLATVAVVTLAPGAAHPIGFIDSPAPTCRRVKDNDCRINWQYLAVDASPNYMIDLWVFIDDALVAKTSGFFQTSLYVDNAHLGDGFPVRCGPADTTPAPVPTPSFALHYGKSYRYTIRARDSANLYSANYGTVVCPPKP